MPRRRASGPGAPRRDAAAPAAHPAGTDAARTRAILEAALDCIVTIDAEGRVVEFNPAAERTFGYRRDEVIGQPLAELIVPPSLRERHRRGFASYLAGGEAKVLGRRVELTAMRRDGSEFPVELAVTRIGGDGPPLFTAYLRDIAARVRAEQLRHLRLAVPQQVEQAAHLAAAADVVVQAVCESLRWDFGAFWVVSRAGDALECIATRNVRGAALAAFEAATRTMRFHPGQGLPGRVWASLTSHWVREIAQDTNFPRAPLAGAGGLHSAFACPIVVGGGAIGVVEFLTAHLHEPDADLLETMDTVARSVGRFVERRRTEDRLREGEARFRALMDQAPFSMQVFAPDGRTLHVNRAWSQLWGVTPEQAGDYNVLADRQLEAKGVRPHLLQAFAGTPVAIPPIRYDPNETIPAGSRHADPVRYVAAVAYPLKDEGGQVREVVLVHEDITARRRAEAALRESEEKLRLLADTIPQLAWMARPDGHIFWFNRRWYEYTGTTPQEMQGWGWQSVHDPAVLPDVVARWRRSIDSGEPFDMVFPLRGADGVYRPFLTRVNPLRDAQGGILYWFGTNTDISEIKRMEAALREADRRKDEFLATLAHELRNPLAPITASLQLLGLPGVDAAVASEARERMERQVRQLVRLVDDLLDMSRIVSGKIELRRRPLDLRAIVAHGIETVQPLLDERGHRIEVVAPGQPLVVDGDEVRLGQAVGNLLANAAKYTEAPSRIVVTLGAAAGAALLAVEDSGIGIVPELLPRIFDPFVQGAQGTVGAQGGLGIGLTLVKTLVELHGGHVDAHSGGAGKGARFTLRLPLAAAVPPPCAAALPPPAGRARQVLVVDDNKDAADSLAEFLRLHSHDVRVAYDGATAVAAAQRQAPEIVFLDIGMPEMDGYETARQLRRLPGMASATLVALTGWGQQEHRGRTADAGFDFHFVKPADPRSLAQVLGGRGDAG